MRLHLAATVTLMLLCATATLLATAVGSKDLTQVVFPSKEGNYPSGSHISHSCGSTAESQVSQCTNIAFGPQSTLGKEHKDTTPDCVLYSDGKTPWQNAGTTSAHSDGRTPKDSGGTTPQHIGGTIQQHSDGTTPPCSGGTTSGHSEGTTSGHSEGTASLHSDGTIPPILTSSAVFNAAFSAKPDPQKIGPPLSTALQDEGSPPGSRSTDPQGRLGANSEPLDNLKTSCTSKFGANLEQQLRAPAYVLFAIDGTWREAREIYKVCLQLLLLCQAF